MILKYTIRFDDDITNTTVNKILSLPLFYHHNRPVGDIVSRINDLSSIKELINNISFTYVIDFIYVVAINIILFMINKIMFLLTLIMLCIYILIYVMNRNNIDNLSYEVKENASISNTYLVESILGIDTIKNLNIENNRKTNFKEKYKTFLNSNLRLGKLVINYGLIQELVCNLASIIIIYVGIILHYNNSLSFSKLISFNTLVIYLFISLKNIISFDQLKIEARNSYKRLQELNYQDKENKTKRIKEINSINFKDLKYSYDNSNNIIDKVNFTINKGDFVFVKGNSGKGKSTIFKLLTKVLECDRGMVFINDIDINDISYNEIIKNICYVSQNEYVFTDSILNNIKLYKNVSKKEIDKVLKITNIDKILEKRNITLDFLLEENGHNLSGGERQRILLARSLLQDKKILVLDETMNELDIESERSIINKIKTEYDITLILISHRDNNSDLFNKVVEV